MPAPRPLATELFPERAGSLERLAARIAECRAALVVTGGGGTAAMLALKAARIARCPLLWDSPMAGQRPHPLAPMADHLLVRDMAMATKLISAGCRPDLMDVFPDTPTSFPDSGLIAEVMRDLIRHSAGLAPAGKANPMLLGWPDPDGRAAWRAMAILDKAQVALAGQDFGLVLPRPDNWRALLERDRPHLLLLGGARFGNGGSWRGRMLQAGAPRPELLEMVETFHARQLPVIYLDDQPDEPEFDALRGLCDHILQCEPVPAADGRQKLRHDAVRREQIAMQIGATPPSCRWAVLTTGTGGAACGPVLPLAETVRSGELPPDVSHVVLPEEQFLPDPGLIGDLLLGLEHGRAKLAVLYPDDGPGGPLLALRRGDFIRSLAFCPPEGAGNPAVLAHCLRQRFAASLVEFRGTGTGLCA
ncbi:hypothetical protein [Gemmobacter nanjingensis]|nr:hypothetical protein [Gemmobacter nanjingensis]